MKKKFFFLAMAMAGLTISLFSFNRPEKKTLSGYKWFDFNGGLAEITDPSYYSRDGDNFPDCPPSPGTIYCEIYAKSSVYDFEQPDLTTVIGSRMRSY